jgi:hypothetical protein
MSFGYNREQQMSKRRVLVISGRAEAQTTASVYDALLVFIAPPLNASSAVYEHLNAALSQTKHLFRDFQNFALYYTLQIVRTPSTNPRSFRS